MTLPSETAILEMLATHFPNRHKNFTLGRGDDCACFHTERALAISSDLFLEDTHFRRSYFSPAEAGHKALAVNLSDLAACGAEPLAFSLNLGLPRDLDAAWLQNFFQGMGALAARFNLFLCGGDLSAADKIQVSITILGQKAENGVFLGRQAARAGDRIFIIGSPGLARLGLTTLEERGRDYCQKNWPKACQAHLMPMPLVETGLILAQFGKSAPIGLMDVSDGLASDLPRLLGPGLGAELTLHEKDLAAEVLHYSRENDADPVKFTLLGGEDYCLLGTCSARFMPELKRRIPAVWQLGTVTKESAITCNSQIIGEGFDHFGKE